MDSSLTRYGEPRPEGQAYIDSVLRPLLAELDLSADETTVHAVWSFARR